MKQLSRIFAIVIAYLSFNVPGVAMDSLDNIDGYYKLNESSKRVVKIFVEKEDKCFTDKLDGDDYPVLDWFLASPRIIRAEILEYHGLYNQYSCSNKERQQMIDQLKIGNEDDLYVLSNLYWRDDIAEPILPPWYTDKQREKVQQLIKKYPKPFDYGRVFFRIEDSKNR